MKNCQKKVTISRISNVQQTNSKKRNYNLNDHISYLHNVSWIHEQTKNCLDQYYLCLTSTSNGQNVFKRERNAKYIMC